MADGYLHGIETIEIDNGIRAIQTAKASLIGVVGDAPGADDTLFPAETPILITGPRMVADLGIDGTLADAYTAIYNQGVNTCVMTRTAATDPDAADIVGDVATQTGVYSLLNSKALLGQTPRLLVAPGFSSDSGVRAALAAIAPRLRGMAIVDGPNTTEAAALAAADAEGSARVIMVDPHVLDTSGISKPPSAYIAGLQSRIDNEKGFWWSASNQLIQGITGTARPISYGINDAETEANRLNGGKVGTIALDDGYRFWGDRSCASDTQWVFYPVRRTADMIYESLETDMRWAMDRPFSVQLIRDIRDSVQRYLDVLKARNATLGGKVWLDEELNTEAVLKAGQLYVDFDIEPPAPLERLSFRAWRNGDYYTETLTLANAA